MKRKSVKTVCCHRCVCAKSLSWLLVAQKIPARLYIGDYSRHFPSFLQLQEEITQFLHGGVHEMQTHFAFYSQNAQKCPQYLIVNIFLQGFQLHCPVVVVEEGLYVSMKRCERGLCGACTLERCPTALWLALSVVVVCLVSVAPTVHGVCWTSCGGCK